MLGLGFLRYTTYVHEADCTPMFSILAYSPVIRIYSSGICELSTTCHVEKGVRSSGRQTSWATTNWATQDGQLGDNVSIYFIVCFCELEIQR